MSQSLLPLAAVFTVAAGYGVVLPVLPFFLARMLNGAGDEAIAWHTGGLTGVYMLGLFVFAPIWGYVSDRIGRRTVMLFGLAGFSGAMLLFGFSQDLALAYASRAFAGLSAAAVMPAVLAGVGDMGTLPQRARGFAWLSAASALGFLFGPALSGGLAALEPVLPFFAVAAMGGVVWLAAYLGAAADTGGSRDVSSALPQVGVPSLLSLLALSLLVMFGLGSFEVSLTLQGQQLLKLKAAEVSLMFVECSLVMILVQAFVFSPLTKRLGSALLALAFLAMAAGIALLPYSASYYMLLLGVGLIAAASGILIPVLAYLVSLTAGARQGTALGAQTAAANLGQAVGSVTAGWLFGIFVEAPFWVTAGLLGLGALLAMRMPTLTRSWIG
jgi:MFS family permease